MISQKEQVSKLKDRERERETRRKNNHAAWNIIRFFTPLAFVVQDHHLRLLVLLLVLLLQVFLSCTFCCPWSKREKSQIGAAAICKYFPTSTSVNGSQSWIGRFSFSKSGYLAFSPSVHTMYKTGLGLYICLLGIHVPNYFLQKKLHAHSKTIIYTLYRNLTIIIFQRSTQLSHYRYT